MKKLILIILGVTLSSCAITQKKYAAPTEGAVATIKFVNNGAGPGSVEFFREYETCKGREMGDPIAASQSKSIQVRSDSPISFSFFYSVDTRYCKIYGTFTPVKGALYQTEISHRPDGCVLNLYKLEGQLFIPESSFKQRKAVSSPWDENSSFCS